MRGHAYPTSWGALPCGDGGAQFRIWAPAMRNLRLAAEGHDDTLAMERDEDGWFSLTTAAVAPGGGYSFVLDDGRRVPDPASREQLADVHGPSRLIDPGMHTWRHDWRGRPWHEAVIYELHVGAFSPEGTFDGLRRRLDHLERLGITAIELMPVAHFAGERGWGYDGVMPYAPHAAYGGASGLKQLVDAAHERGLMVLLDVVYNHFGPEGNYLHLYAPDFFHPETVTPWGAAMAYELPAVAAFFIENALYWIEEYRVDGLRLDAIDQIGGEAGDRMLRDLARAVRERVTDREVHLTTEDDRNIVSLHERDRDDRPRLYTAEWNDDVHHAAHVIATGEHEGYYRDFADAPLEKLARGLGEGFAFQGEPSIHRDGRRRGEPSGQLPATAFVNFLQNHDQIGNRAFGDRLSELAPPERVEALTAILLLAPSIPLLFMGEEWAERRPFCFFTDFHGDLADAVREGRRAEFGAWSSFSDVSGRELIPDPNDPGTFMASRLDWGRADDDAGARRMSYVRHLLAVRRDEIAPRLGPRAVRSLQHDTFDGGAFCVRWRLGDGGQLALLANLDDDAWPMPEACRPDCADERLVFETAPGVDASLRSGELPAWSVVVRVSGPRSTR